MGVVAVDGVEYLGSRLFWTDELDPTTSKATKATSDGSVGRRDASPEWKLPLQMLGLATVGPCTGATGVGSVGTYPVAQRQST